MLRGFVHPHGFANLKINATFGMVPIHSEAPYKLPWVTGEIKDVFLVALWFLLSSPAAEHIGQCPEQKCPESGGRKLFFKPTRRAVYCSKTCSSRARVRRMRAKPPRRDRRDKLRRIIRERRGKAGKP